MESFLGRSKVDPQLSTDPEYRQALRDLHSTLGGRLDEAGQKFGLRWPVQKAQFTGLPLFAQPKTEQLNNPPSLIQVMRGVPSAFTSTGTYSDIIHIQTLYPEYADVVCGMEILDVFRFEPKLPRPFDPSIGGWLQIMGLSYYRMYLSVPDLLSGGNQVFIEIQNDGEQEPDLDRVRNYIERVKSWQLVDPTNPRFKS